MDPSLRPLTTVEALWLATVGGGAIFGRVGAFEPGWEFDAIVLDDATLRCPRELTVAERVERAVRLGGRASAWRTSSCVGLACSS